MKLMIIVYSHAIDEEIVEAVRDITGAYTKFTGVQGEGEGEPHLGSHVWPGINNCMMVAADAKAEKKLKETLLEIREKFSESGIRMFSLPLNSML